MTNLRYICLSLLVFIALIDLLLIVNRLNQMDEKLDILQKYITRTDNMFYHKLNHVEDEINELKKLVKKGMSK